MERKIRQFCKWNRVFRRISHVRARTLFEVLVSSFESIIFSTRDTPVKVTLNTRARGERFEKIVTLYQFASTCQFYSPACLLLTIESRQLSVKYEVSFTLKALKLTNASQFVMAALSENIICYSASYTFRP